MLEALASERRIQRAMSDRVELVWTTLEALPSAARETSVVVRSLCQAARRRVLLANFAFDRPKDWDEVAKERARWLWRPLAENMAGNPELEVTLIAEISRKQDDERDEAELVDALVILLPADLGDQRDLELGVAGHVLGQRPPQPACALLGDL
ncbi:MAG: hypothetical protein R6X02_24650, partial [Enhygromyxa sp.]